MLRNRYFSKFQACHTFVYFSHELGMHTGNRINEPGNLV